MPAIGITGGVATGKSSFTRVFLEEMKVEFVDADACVHEMLRSDKKLLSEISEQFGQSVLAHDGSLNRAAVRELAFQDESIRKTLERLIHPRVKEQWLPRAQAARQSREIFLVDIPLLFETSAETELDRVLVVACSPNIQRKRMSQNRGLASELIERMIASQLDLVAKVSRADHVVWNDGLPTALNEQARLFAATLRDLYG